MLVRFAAVVIVLLDLADSDGDCLHLGNAFATDVVSTFVQE